MNYIYIGITTLTAFIIGQILIVLLNKLFIKIKTNKLKINLSDNTKKDNIKLEKLENIDKLKNEYFLKAFYELKNNIAVFEQINELIKHSKEKDLSNIFKNLKKFSSNNIFETGKISNLSKKEFEILDSLYSVVILKSKSELYFELFKQSKITLLELRAKVREFIDYAKKIESDFKTYYCNNNVENNNFVKKSLKIYEK